MKQYKILGQMKMEKLEEELNRLADDGWHVSVVYPYQFKEQLSCSFCGEPSRQVGV